ncbi:hypothetical protein Tco_0156915 [Tanacetum coccineum]
MFTHDHRSAKVSKGFESPNLQGRVNSPGSSIFVGSEFGSELTVLAGSELKTSELDTSDKLSAASYVPIIGLSSELYVCPANIIYLHVCPAIGSTCADTMADMNIPANDAPAEQAPAIAPPTRTDDQVLSLSKWVPISKRPLRHTSTGLYKCQLDEQWFNLHKDLLRDALDITPTNDNNPFVAPPSSDTVIEYVNTLGYPCKTVGYDRPRHHVLQILWDIIHRSNIDYAERI